MAIALFRQIPYPHGHFRHWRGTLERPDTLLKSALEKVVFFECRIDQLTSELAQAHGEIDRLKADLSAAAEREVGLRQQIASAESRAGQMQRERDEAAARVGAAQEERERILGRLIESEQIRQAGEEGDGVDLANFIAELRAEVLSLRAAAAGQGTAVPSSAALAAASVRTSLPAPRAEGFASAEQAAERLAAEGRLGVSARDCDSLTSHARFDTRAEETLFSLSLRDLSSTDAVSRARAAQRLKAIAPRAALPAVAAALNAEQVPETKVAFLEVLGAAGDGSVLPLVRPHLADPSAEVRLAALETGVRLADEAMLARALEDPSPRVRRRAALLASNASDVPLLRAAAKDADASVRRVAILGLGASLGAQAEDTLLAAMEDEDVTVRRAAAKGLSHTFGPETFAVADMESARRRREVRRLAMGPRKASGSARPAAAEGPGPLAGGVAGGERACVEPVAPAAPAPAADPQLEGEIVSRLRAALRGRTEQELATELAAPAEVVMATTRGLEQSGRLVRRGQRYFVA